MSNLNLGLTSSQDGVVEGKCVWELALGGRTGQGTCGVIFLLPQTPDCEDGVQWHQEGKHSP